MKSSLSSENSRWQHLVVVSLNQINMKTYQSCITLPITFTEWQLHAQAIIQGAHYTYSE